MITATKNPTNENDNEFLQARNKLKKVSSNGITANIMVEEKEDPPVTSSENITVTSGRNNRQERTLAILSDTPNLDEIIQYIKSNGFEIIATKKFEFTTEEAEEFYEDHAKQNYYEKCIRWLSSSKLCALILEKEDAIKDWRQLMGPTTYKKARKTSPNSVRALFGKDASQNATHGSDSDLSANKEIKYLFDDMAIAAVNTDFGAQKNEETEAKGVSQQFEKSTSLSNAKVVDEAYPFPNKEEEEAVAEPTKEALSSDAINDTVINDDVKQDASSLEPQVSKFVEEAQNIREQEAKIDNAAPIKVDTEIKPMSIDSTSVKNEQTENVMQPEIEKGANAIEKEEKQQDSNLIVAAAANATATAASVATTVVSGVTEAASAAAIAVSTAITSSGTDEMKNNDNPKDNKSEQKAVTIEDNPVIYDIIIPKPKIEEPPTSTQEDNGTPDEHTTETTVIVPEIETTTDQEKSDSGSDLNEIPCTIISDKLSQGIKSADANTDQGDNSSRTSTSNDSNRSNVENQDILKNVTKRVIKKSVVHPSNSRIRPPSINRGQYNTEKTNIPADAVKKPAEGSDHKIHPQSRTTKASSSGGSRNASATRIARLSTPIKKAIEPQQPHQPPVQQQQVKKAATKVSKRLPRVATLAKSPMPSPKVEQEVKDSVNTTEKPKKRLSSTKSFISRLTAPTVASANKKAVALGTTETEHAPPTRRTSTLRKRQSLTVKPSKSNSISPQVASKGDSNDATSVTTPGHQQQQPNNEMTSISTNDSFSRPTTPNKKDCSSDNSDDKNQTFIDTVLETTV